MYPCKLICLQAVEKLKLDTETPAAGVRPKGLGMVSCVGTEYVSFKSPLPLDNKVCLIYRVKYHPARVAYTCMA